MSAMPPDTAVSNYPQRPIRFVVAFAVNGPGDLLARLIGQKLSERWGQPVNVENHPGTGGMKGGALGLKAPADGYTFILYSAPHSINPGMYKQMPYDALKDFQAVTLMISMPNILVCNARLPVNSVADLIKLAQQRPGQLKYASGGVGTPSHLGAECIKTMAGIDIKHVQFDGHATAGAALQRGDVDVMLDAMLLALPEVKEGKIKALGVTSAQRLGVAGDIPSIAESGLPGFDFSPGVGVLVRAGTPMAIVNKIHQEIADILRTPEVRERLTRDGANIVASSPQEFSAYIEAEVNKWAKVIAAAGIEKQ